MRPILLGILALSCSAHANNKVGNLGIAPIGSPITIAGSAENLDGSADKIGKWRIESIDGNIVTMCTLEWSQSGWITTVFSMPIEQLPLAVMTRVQDQDPMLRDWN